MQTQNSRLGRAQSQWGNPAEGGGGLPGLHNLLQFLIAPAKIWETLVSKDENKQTSKPFCVNVVTCETSLKTEECQNITWETALKWMTYFLYKSEAKILIPLVTDGGISHWVCFLNVQSELVTVNTCYISFPKHTYRHEITCHHPYLWS